MGRIKAFFEGFVHGFKSLGHKITNIVNFILLFFVYFIGVGITWLFAKVFGKKFLDVKRGEKGSYWIKEKIGKRKIEEYYRSF